MLIWREGRFGAYRILTYYFIWLLRVVYKLGFSNERKRSFLMSSNGAPVDNAIVLVLVLVLVIIICYKLFLIYHKSSVAFRISSMLSFFVERKTYNTQKSIDTQVDSTTYSFGAIVHFV